MSIPREQPPEELSERVKAYLNRRFDSIADALEQPSGYPIRKEMPYKPQVGVIHYFGNPATHNYDAAILTEGFWGLTSTAWVKLG